jgi:hypothetical protein
MNCKGKNRLLRKHIFIAFVMAGLILFGGLLTADAVAEGQARIGTPLHEGADPTPWFDKDAGANYEYNYGHYDPYFYTYYHPGYKKDRFEDDWYYDTYDQEGRDAGAGPEAEWAGNATFWGGYDTQDMNDDWYYDYYDPNYFDYYRQD